MHYIPRSWSLEAMHVLCSLIPGKGYCGGKLTDVTHSEKKLTIGRDFTGHRNSEYDEELTEIDPIKSFHVKTLLEIGDPSRNVIEKIFITTTPEMTRCSTSINGVLKLTNSKETLERFESFREGVKKRAYELNNKHPRNMVDGNEKLLFYGTTPGCCKKIATSNLCRESNCNICSIIKSGFHTKKTKNSGIWLSTSCQDLINANTMKLKMAIIFCRVITGRIVDMVDRDIEGNYDSMREAKSNYLFVRNPCSILPCFVIILSCT